MFVSNILHNEDEYATHIVGEGTYFSGAFVSLFRQLYGQASLPETLTKAVRGGSFRRGHVKLRGCKILIIPFLFDFSTLIFLRQHLCAKQR